MAHHESYIKPNFKDWMKAQGYTKFLGFWAKPTGGHLSGFDLFEKRKEHSLL